jgi:hypothetical protein
MLRGNALERPQREEIVRPRRSPEEGGVFARLSRGAAAKADRHGAAASVLENDHWQQKHRDHAKRPDDECCKHPGAEAGDYEMVRVVGPLQRLCGLRLLLSLNALLGSKALGPVGLCAVLLGDAWGAVI